jgi:hypothetical protein
MQRLMQPEIKYRMNIKTVQETEWIKSARMSLPPDFFNKVNSPVPRPRLSLQRERQVEGYPSSLNEVPSKETTYTRSPSQANTRDCLSSSEVFAPSDESRLTTAFRASSFTRFG